MTLRQLRRASRVLLNSATWHLYLAEFTKRRRPPVAPPEIRVVREDLDAGLRLVEIQGQGYWVPLGMDPGGFRILYPEVFDTEHPHNYEFGRCQVRTGDVVVDAGASEGLFTRFALLR